MANYSAFHYSSKYVYDWIRKQPKVKEESITDWLLYDLSNNIDQLCYKEFTRREETKIGADWEWWILNPEYAYRFRVQAKKLKNGDNWGAIGYTNKKGDVQMDCLISSSQGDGAFPLYAFYSVEEQNTVEVLKMCKGSAANLVQWCSNCINGVYVSPASNMKELIFSRPKEFISEKNVLNQSIKLSVFDIFRAGKADWDTSGIEKELDKLCEHSNIQFKYVYSKRKDSDRILPGYASCFAEYSKRKEKFDWFEKEFRRDLPETQGMVVLDMRDISNQE